MTLEDFFHIIEQHTSDYDRPTAIRVFRRFCNSFPQSSRQSTEEYILTLLPKAEDILISDILRQYGTSDPYSLQQAIRWFQEQKLPIIDTLCGSCVRSVAADTLCQFLDTAIPVESEFDRYCQSCSIPFNRALFESFRRKYGRHLVKTRFHPFSSEFFFYLEQPEALAELFAEWSVETFAYEDSVVAGYLSIQESAAILGLTQPQLLSWLYTHRDVWEIQSGRAIIPTPIVLDWCSRWKSVSSIPSILLPQLEQIPSKSRRHVQDSVDTHLRESKPQWILARSSLPQQLDNLLYTSDADFARQKLQELIYSFPVHPLQLLKDITGLTLHELREKISAGIINAKEDESGNFYVSKNEIDRIATINESFIPVDEIVSDLAETECSLFDINRQNDRQRLLEHCNSHNWWDISHVDCGGLPLGCGRLGIAVLRDDQHLLTSPLSLWLKCAHQPTSTRFGIIVDHFAPQFPDTVKNLKRFAIEKHPADLSLVDMVQFLFQHLSKDADMYNQEFTHELVNRFIATSATTAACIALADFLLFGEYTNRRYVFSAYGTDMDTSAYSLGAFKVIVAHIVNDNVIVLKDLIGKSLSSKCFADLWLYVALHVYASWRSTDYIRMLPPRLPCSGSEMLAKIRDGNLSTQEATEIAQYFIELNKLALNVPSKTAGTVAVPKLYFYCPESCLEVFGLVLAISAAHYEMTPSAPSFVVPTTDIYLIKQFFGNDFAQACDFKNFSGRRANKALMQSVESLGREDDLLPPLVAYHLASIMRSHKLSYGKISESTDIYLHDANFSNLTPEFVIKQMWERGVCSFVTDTMIKQCYGSKYTILPVAQQTAAIHSLGLSPMQVSKLLRHTQDMEDKAVETVMATCQDPTALELALQNIALGHGTGKDYDVFCLLKALGKECAFKERSSCLGCRFEIRTKALFLQYAVNHQQLLSAAESAPGTEKARLEHLCRTTTYPAMAEILSHLKPSSIDSEIALYKNLIKEVPTYGLTTARQDR